MVGVRTRTSHIKPYVPRKGHQPKQRLFPQLPVATGQLRFQFRNFAERSREEDLQVGDERILLSYRIVYVRKIHLASLQRYL